MASGVSGLLSAAVPPVVVEVDATCCQFCCAKNVKGQVNNRQIRVKNDEEDENKTTSCWESFKRFICCKKENNSQDANPP